MNKKIDNFSQNLHEKRIKFPLEREASVFVHRKAAITSAETQENERRVIKPSYIVILILFRVCKPRYGVGVSFHISSLHTSEVRLKTVRS